MKRMVKGVALLVLHRSLVRQAVLPTHREGGGPLDGSGANHQTVVLQHQWVHELHTHLQDRP